MPAILTDRQVCSTTVPLAWRPLIVDLEKFLEAAHLLQTQGVTTSAGDTPPFLLNLHARLMSRSAALLEPEAIADQPPEADAQLLARATLMLTRLSECVAAGADERLDTAGSRTLGNFRADFDASAEGIKRLRRALAKLPELSEARLSIVEQEVAHDIQDAERKQRVVRALRHEFDLWPHAPNLRNNIWRFFSALYPNSGLQPDEVELIVTGCLVFFCIPYAGTELLTERFRRAAESEQAIVRRFLRRVSRFAHWQFAHFPVFGFLQGSRLPESLLATLATAAGLTPAQTAHEISRLTAIVPLQEVDKYVPHDVWGHSWQASMLHYDDFYEELSRFAEPLPLTQEVRTVDGRLIRLGECFAIQDGRATLSEPAFRDFAAGIVLQRLAIALSPVLAELIADIAEFKFLELEPHRAHELPNSSLLQSFPSKLDLMLQDVFFYFRQATKAMRLWSQQAVRQQRTSEELVAQGASPASARAAVAGAVSIWQALEADLFAPKMIWSNHDDSLRVNVVTRVALNFVGIHRSTLETYQLVARLDVGRLPLRSFRDLLLLATAVFFEADPPRNLWRVDEFVSLRVVPWFERLARALET